jgi:hypothetical protein
MLVVFLYIPVAAFSLPFHEVKTGRPLLSGKFVKTESEQAYHFERYAAHGNK